MPIRDTLRKVAPSPLLSAYRALARWRAERHMLANMNAPARELYRRATLTSYAHVQLSDVAVRVRAAVEEAARTIYGERWNFYSDALRPEIVEGFQRTLDAFDDSRKLDYLEIGSCQGLSLSLIALMLRERGTLGSVTSIDPYFESGYDEGDTGPYANRLHVDIDKQTKASALRLYRALDLEVELVEARSIDGLRSLIRAGRLFDLIYIDGSHERLWPAVDFGMCCAALRSPGIIILDDHLWPDVAPIKALCDAYATRVQETWKTASYRIDLETR